MNLVFKEMKWDDGLPTSINDFVDITSTTNMDNYFSNNPYVHLTDTDFAGYYVVCVDWGNANLSDQSNVWQDNNGDVYIGSMRYLEAYKGNGWGDDNQFQIISGISTRNDDNGNKVLYGQKAIKLPNFLD
jgi:hypothetical protein